MAVQILFVTLFICFVLSVPIAVALGGSSLIALQIQNLPMITVAQSIFESLNSFSLMAVPFFILAGNLMQSGGIARRLVNLANSLVGWIRGGLGAVAVLTSMFFATLSGSSSATTAAVGSILINAMDKKGYSRRFATSICAASGELGVIIPPSLSMIVYGLSANVSIGALFIAGILPGFLISASLIVTVSIVSKIKGYDTVESFHFGKWIKGVFIATKEAFLALMMPVIILGGIYQGWFTPTEAAVVAVVYGLVIGIFVYKELKWGDLLKIFSRSAVTTSIIMLIVAFASIFAYILTMNQVPHKLGSFITDFTESKIVFLILVNILLLITGMFIETLASIIILAPILAPVAIQFGIDPIHFGVIMVVNLAVGMVTPPVGVNLFVACQIANLRLDQIMRPIALFLVVLVINIFLISYLPFLSTWLPRVL